MLSSFLPWPFSFPWQGVVSCRCPGCYLEKQPFKGPPADGEDIPLGFPLLIWMLRFLIFNRAPTTVDSSSSGLRKDPIIVFVVHTLQETPWVLLGQMREDSPS